MNSKKIRCGIISAASIVPRFVRGMRLTEDGEISAIASRSLEKASRAAEELNIPKACGDYHEILNDPDINTVYIPLVNSLHYAVSREALLAGKNVLTEKPFALHHEEVLELAALAKEKNLFITEAVKTPHLPLYQEIRKIIRSGELGRICFMEFRQSYTEGPYISGWNKEKKYGGGVLFGNEAYFFTMTEFLAGKVVSCSGTLSFGEHDVEDQCSLSVLTENNAVATLSVSTDVLFRNGLTIHLQNGKIEIPDYWKADTACIERKDREPETISFPFESEFVFELNHYNECILNGLNESPVTPMENTARYIAFCEKLKEQY